MKWRFIFCVIRICFQDINSKFYGVIVRPTIYGVQCLPIEFPYPKEESWRHENVERDVWHTKRDKIRNETTRNMMGVGSDQMQEVKLWCFEHVNRKCAYIPMWQVKNKGLEEVRSRPNKLWVEIIRWQDMTQLQLTEDITLDWRMRRSSKVIGKSNIFLFLSLENKRLHLNDKATRLANICTILYSS